MSHIEAIQNYLTGSIYRRTLTKLAIRVALVIVIVTSIAYFHIVSVVTDQNLGQLEKYISERGERERGIFALAEANHKVLKRELLQRLKDYGDGDPKDRFDRLFAGFPDGTTRTRLEGFDGEKQAFGFIGPQVTIDADIRRRVVIFNELSIAYGPPWHHQLQNVYFTAPENILVGYWPEVPTWAHDVSPDLFMPDEEFMWAADKKHNPSRDTVWTGLFYDETGKTWMVSVETPVDVGRKQIATIGHDIPLNEIMDRTIKDVLEGAHNFIMRKDGRLIAHPKWMAHIEDSGGDFDVNKSGTDYLKTAHALITNRAPGQHIIDNSEYGEYLAVTDIKEPGWFLVIVYPKHLVSAVAFQTAQIILLLGFASLLIEIFIFYRVLKKDISEPLVDLAGAADKIADGDLSVRLETRYDDELGRFAKSFNVMTESVESRTSQLIESEDRYALAVSGSNDGLWDWNIETNKNYMSPRFKEILGYQDDELENDVEVFFNALHPDDVERINEEVRKHFEEHVPYNTEYRLRRKDGDYIWIHAKGQAVWDDDGKPLRMAGSISDITERKKSDDALKASEARFAGILDIEPEAVIALGAKMNIRLFNQGAERIFGYDADEVIGQSLEMLMPERFRNGHKKHIEEFDRSRETYRLMDQRQEIFGLKKDGTEFPASASVSKLEINGEIINTVLLQDITQRKEAEEALLDAKNEAEQANRAKSEFLAAMSHELRTPLNAILGFADIIGHQYFGPVGEKYQEYAGDIQASGMHLLELVNDILDLSAIEAGKQSLIKEKLSTLEIITECETFIEGKARTNGIGLTITIPDDLPPLYADKRAAKQILLNLLSNAVKFTPNGGKITVSAKATKKTTTLKITDTGIGIPAENIPKLTDPFTRGGTDPYRTEQGWGLGLSITKSLVDLHDGTLDIQSKLGKGTTVTVTLPNGV
ncbi:MAG: PAS domain S-box protein [Alphaproteobacteria bacterium]|nr:PAS domain S-box protein [Alphaproteobacteria bacterium]